MKRSIFLRILGILLITLGSIVLSFDEGFAAGENCGVPVCNLPVFLDQLQGSPQGIRFKTVTDLRSKNKKSTDPAVWANLLEVGAASEELFLKLEEEDWLIREAQALVDASIMGLFKFRRPIESGYLTSLYRRMSSENTRFEALKTLGAIIPKFEDLEPLRELITFGDQARLHSVSIEDQNWVAEEAQRVSVAATSRLVMLDPAHEGTFDVTTECPHNGCGSYPELSKLVITDTGSSGYGLVLNFPTPNGGTPAYSFQSAMFRGGPETIVATSVSIGSSTPRPAEVRITLDRDSGFVTGEIRDSRSPGVLRFNAKPIVRVQTITQEPVAGPIAGSDDLPGVYKAKMGDREGRLILRRSLDGLIYASFTSETINLDFKGASYVPQKSMLTLITVSLTQNIIKCSLKVELTEDGSVKLRGFSYSNRNAQTLDWKAEKVSALDEIP